MKVEMSLCVLPMTLPTAVSQRLGESVSLLFFFYVRFRWMPVCPFQRKRNGRKPCWFFKEHSELNEVV